MDTQQIDVMVADASHEVYVDTILETIRNAAAVRGTGIAERTHFQLRAKRCIASGSEFLNGNVPRQIVFVLNAVQTSLRKGFVKKSLSSLTLHKEVRYTVCNSRIFRPPTFREIFP